MPVVPYSEIRTLEDLRDTVRDLVIKTEKPPPQWAREGVYTPLQAGLDVLAKVPRGNKEQVLLEVFRLFPDRQLGDLDVSDAGTLGEFFDHLLKEIVYQDLLSDVEFQAVIESRL